MEPKIFGICIGVEKNLRAKEPGNTKNLPETQSLVLCRAFGPKMFQQIIQATFEILGKQSCALYLFSFNSLFSGFGYFPSHSSGWLYLLVLCTENYFLNFSTAMLFQLQFCVLIEMFAMLSATTYYIFAIFVNLYVALCSQQCLVSLYSRYGWKIYNKLNISF